MSQEQRSAEMAEIMHAVMRQPGLLQKWVQAAFYEARVNKRADAGCKDKPAFNPSGTGKHFLFKLSGAMLPEFYYGLTKGLALPPALLENQCVGQAELVIDVSNQGERVGTCDEVLLDYDCGSSTCSFEAASAALEHHVSGRDSSSKVHPTILDNCRKTIAVGSYIRNFAGRMRNVRVVGVRQELDLSGTTEQSEVSSAAR